MNQLITDGSLSAVLNEIEGKLKVKINHFERLMKIYGSNANCFIVKAKKADGKYVDFFLKFISGEMLTNEIEGSISLSKYVLTPKIILSSPITTRPHGWILYEHIKGVLFTEKFLKEETNPNYFKSLLKLEEAKEETLKNMYLNTPGDITFSGYMSLKANELFLKRITGDRFNEFYTYDNNCISKYFNFKIKINNHLFKENINDIFNSIKSKYKMIAPEKVVNSNFGHGDGHHGNILYTEDKSIQFLDNEYFGNLPVFMEMSKPYYNDFLGELFFHYRDLLNQYFSLEEVNEENGLLAIKVEIKEKMLLRLAITETKLNMRKKLIKNQENCDFLTLNDYLVMCHTLTKNPNYYDRKTRYLFLAFILIMAKFDPFDPNTIYSFF